MLIFLLLKSLKVVQLSLKYVKAEDSCIYYHNPHCSPGWNLDCSVVRASEPEVHHTYTPNHTETELTHMRYKPHQVLGVICYATTDVGFGVYPKNFHRSKFSYMQSTKKEELNISVAASNCEGEMISIYNLDQPNQ